LFGLKASNPTADRFVAVVPPGWLAKYTTAGSRVYGKNNAYFVDIWPLLQDVLIAEAQVGSRLYGLPHALPITAHELGHSYGFNRECEEADENCDGIRDRHGVTASPGLWVDKKIPIQPSASRPIYNFMGTYLGENWVNSNTYLKLLQDHK
jgi:hypothetical protein